VNILLALHRWTGRIALVLVAGFLLAAAVSCSDITAPAPRRIAPSGAAKTEYPGPDGMCRSGYSVATGRNGETICVPDGET
jgi:hypothetical protein